MNLAEIRHRLPMYTNLVNNNHIVVRVQGNYMGRLYADSSKMYFVALCRHEDEEYAKRDKFLSFFTYTKVITLDDFYKEIIYELHGFKNDYK